MSNRSDYEDALPLLAYKIAPRQFDLSYRFSNISLRDQIVRAQTLIRTLFNTGLVSAKAIEQEEEFQLLICGAGAAGLAAAKEAEALGISFVLIEKDQYVPGGVLRSDAPRYVSTAMYEWPHPNHTQHSYPLSSPALLGADRKPLPSLCLEFTTPVSIKEFGEQITATLGKNIASWSRNFVRFQRGSKLKRRYLLIKQATLSEPSKNALKAMLGSDCTIHGMPLHNEQLPGITLDSASGITITAEFRFRYVIYAVGFAKESRAYAKDKPPFADFEHTPFWDKDLVFDKKLGFSKKPHVGILGSGDGALQDALRCIADTRYRHPLEIWNALMECDQKGFPTLANSPHVREAMARLAAADGYTTGGAIWSQEAHVFKSLDGAFESVIDTLIQNEGPQLQHAVDSIMRKDVKQVTIVTQDGYFSKAYALNRFLVLLFHKLLASSASPGKVILRIRTGTVSAFHPLGSSRRGAHLEFEGSARSMKCDLMIIRGGLDRSEQPFQLVGLSGRDTGRIGLGRIPAPIRPVSINKGSRTNTTSPSASGIGKKAVV